MTQNRLQYTQMIWVVMVMYKLKEIQKNEIYEEKAGKVYEICNENEKTCFPKTEYVEQPCGKEYVMKE